MKFADDPKYKIGDYVTSGAYRFPTVGLRITRIFKLTDKSLVLELACPCGETIRLIAEHCRPSPIPRAFA